MIASGPVSDNAGNNSEPFKIDLTTPTSVAFVGGSGASYYFGEVSAQPTCTADNAVSGLIWV